MVGAGVLSLPYAMAYLGWYTINSSVLGFFKCLKSAKKLSNSWNCWATNQTARARTHTHTSMKKNQIIITRKLYTKIYVIRQSKVTELPWFPPLFPSCFDTLFLKQGSGDNGDGLIMVHHPQHHVADDTTPWMCSGSSIRSLLWTRSTCLWAKTWAMDCDTTAANCPSWLWHSVHGHWRQVPQEVHGDSMYKLHQDQAILLDLHLWIHPFLPVSATQFQFCFWCFISCSNHVTKVCA